jgi:hypothetical protein
MVSESGTEAPFLAGKMVMYRRHGKCGVFYWALMGEEMRGIFLVVLVVRGGKVGLFVAMWK